MGFGWAFTPPPSKQSSPILYYQKVYRMSYGADMAKHMHVQQREADDTARPQNIRSLNWIGVAAEKHFVRRGKDGNQCDDRAKASEYFMSNDVVLIADDKFPTRRYTEIKRHWLPDEWRHLWLVLQHNIGAWTVMCESCNFTNAYANWGRQSNMHYAQKYHTAVRREPCT